MLTSILQNEFDYIRMLHMQASLIAACTAGCINYNSSSNVIFREIIENSYITP